MKIYQIITEHNASDIIILTEAKSYKLWESAGQKIVEAKLTPDQVTSLFKYVETGSTATGNNRTMIGKSKDAVGAVNKAWEDLKTKVQNSGPIKNVDSMYDSAADKLKQATGGDQGVMKYVQKYRDFAKKHPISQSLIYAALIAAAGISGAGLGGAAALGLFKMTDKLLQGEKFSSAAYQGAKTGGLAYGASQLMQYFKNPEAPVPPKTEVKLPDGTEYVVKKGDTLSQIAQRNGISVDELMKANQGQAHSMGGNEFNMRSDVYQAGDSGPSSKVNNPDRLSVGQKLNVPNSTGSNTYQGGVGTARDTWDKVGAGKYSHDQISANQAAKYGIDTGGIGDASKAGGKMASKAASMASNADSTSPQGVETNNVSGITGDQISNHPVYQSMIQKFGDNPGGRRAAMAAAKAAIAKGQMNESVHLTESQIYMVIGNIVNRQHRLDEGIMDTIKSATGKATDWVKTKGTNLTTKITADKLLQAWKKAGSPTDSAKISQILTVAGVTPPVIASAYKSLGIRGASKVKPQAASAGAFGNMAGQLAPSSSSTGGTTTSTPNRTTHTANPNNPNIARTTQTGNNSQTSTTPGSTTAPTSRSTTPGSTQQAPVRLTAKQIVAALPTMNSKQLTGIQNKLTKILSSKKSKPTSPKPKNTSKPVATP